MKSETGDHSPHLDQSEGRKGLCCFVKQSEELTIQDELLQCSAFFTLLPSLELIHLPSLSFPCVQVPQILSPSAVIIETPTLYSLSLANTHTQKTLPTGVIHAA